MYGAWHCRQRGRKRGAATRPAAPAGVGRSNRTAGRNRGRLTSSGGHAIVAPVDEGALDRARERLADASAGKPQPADVEAALERARSQVEALAATAADLEASLLGRAGGGAREGC